MARAAEALRQSEAVLRAHPEAGRRYEGHADVREWKISGTAFSLLYAEARGTVWVIDVRHQRGLRGAEAMRTFVAELWSGGDPPLRIRGPSPSPSPG